MPWREALCRNLTQSIAEQLNRLSREEAKNLTEIRIRTGERIGWFFVRGMRRSEKRIGQAEMDELVNALCSYSRYAYEAQLAQGYIPLSGGHRAGVCGRVVYENGAIARMSHVCSICIRIAKHIEGASRPFRSHLIRDGIPGSVLLLGAPGSGKTTAIRDAALYLAGECGVQVAAADEREELFFADAALGIDVLSGAKKAEAVRMLIRSMAPQVLVTDEIGGMDDAWALLDASACGTGLLATAHAAGMADVLRRPALRLLYEQGAFQHYVLLGGKGRCEGIFDAQGKLLMEGRYGQQGSCNDRMDCNHYAGDFAGRWGTKTDQMGTSHAALPGTLGGFDSL